MQIPFINGLRRMAYMDKPMRRYEVIVNEERFEVPVWKPWIAVDKAVQRYCEAHPMAAARKRKNGYSLLIQLRRINELRRIS